MKKIRISLVALSCMFLATPTLAQDGGAYLGVGFLSASTKNADDFAVAANGPGAKGDKTATGPKVYGGYMFSPRFGVEAGYYGLGTYEVKSAGGTTTDEFKITALAVSAVGAFPFAESFNLHGKLGLAYASSDYTCKVGCGGIFVDTKKTSVVPVFGIGVGWNATKSISLALDLEFFSQVNHAVSSVENKDDYTVFSLNAQYNF